MARSFEMRPRTDAPENDIFYDKTLLRGYVAAAWFIASCVLERPQRRGRMREEERC